MKILIFNPKTLFTLVYTATQYLKETPIDSFEIDTQSMPIAFVLRFDKFFSASIISRFVARFGFYSTDASSVWKNGILFIRRNDRYLINCDFKLQKIFVRTEKGQTKNEMVKIIYLALIQIADNEPNISISLDNKKFETSKNIDNFNQSDYWFCSEKKNEVATIKENNIRVKGNGNIILQDINGNDITINYNDTEKLEAVIEKFQMSKQSEHIQTVQYLEFIKQTITWIKNAIQPIDQIKELIYEISRNQEIGFANLQLRQDKHDENFAKAHKNQYEIKEQINVLYNNIISELRENNIDIKRIEKIVDNINKQTQSDIDKTGLEIAEHINYAFEQHSEKIDKKLKTQYDKLKKTDNWTTKLKLSVPFLNLIGINIEHEVKLNKYLKWIHNTF